MSKIRDELNEKISAVRRLQMELNRRDDEGDDILENLKKSIVALERETASLKVSIILCHCKGKKKKKDTVFMALGLGICYNTISTSRWRRMNLRPLWTGLQQKKNCRLLQRV